MADSKCITWHVAHIVIIAVREPITSHIAIINFSYRRFLSHVAIKTVAVQASDTSRTVGFCVMTPPIHLPCRNQELLIVTLSVSCCHHKSCSARTRHFSYWCLLCHNATKAVAMQESDTSNTGRFCVMLPSNQLQCRNQTLFKLVASVS